MLDVRLAPAICNFFHDLVSEIVSVTIAEEFSISVPSDRLGKVNVEFGNGRIVQIDGSESAVARFRRSDRGVMSPEPFRFDEELVPSDRNSLLESRSINGLIN